MRWDRLPASLEIFHHGPVASDFLTARQPLWRRPYAAAPPISFLQFAIRFINSP
jgi:hypothetical protein